MGWGTQLGGLEATVVGQVRVMVDQGKAVKMEPERVKRFEKTFRNYFLCLGNRIKRILRWIRFPQRVRGTPKDPYFPDRHKRMDTAPTM